MTTDGTNETIAQRDELLPASAAESARRRPDGWLFALLLIPCAAFVAFTHWPVLSAQAAYIDDQDYVAANPLVRNPSWASVERFFGEILKPSTVPGYYQPLAMTSLMLDWAGGGRPGDYFVFHRTNLVLHTLSALLVAVLFYLLFQNAWVAALAGLLFGVHPLTVESVAWVAERKALLATFFSLGALVCYVLAVRRRAWWWHVPAVIAFALSLLSKPTVVMLPLLLLLLDWWPLRRIRWWAILEKTPYFVLAAAGAIVTFVSQARAGAVEMPQEHGPWRILLTLCYNVVLYLRNVFWPAELVPYYPVPEPQALSNSHVLVGVIGTGVLVVVLLVSLRWTRALAAGWLFFFVAILPTMGVIGFTHVVAADKYAYMPLLGLLLIVAWAAQTWLERGAHLARSWRVAVLATLALPVLGAAHVANRQYRHWRDTETLYRFALRHAPHATPLMQNFGTSLAADDKLKEAVAQYEAALAINPNLPRTRTSLGNALARLGDPRAALHQFALAIQLDPKLDAAQNGMGGALLQLNQLDEALPHLWRAIELNPALPDAHANLGALYAKQGDLDRALEECATAVRLRPEFAQGHYNLGVVHLLRGEPQLAEEQLRQAIALRSDYVAAYRKLGELLLSQRRWLDAAQVFEQALQIAPGDAELQQLRQTARERAGVAP